MLLAAPGVASPCSAQSAAASEEALPPLPDDLLLAPVVPSAPAPSQPAAHKWLSHTITLESSIWPGELPAGVDRAWFELAYQPRLSGDLGAGFALTAELLLRASQGMRSTGAHATRDGNSVRVWSGAFHRNPDRQTVLIKEAQLAWAGYGLELTLGTQIVAWGKADGVRPLDVFQTQDLSDPLRAETLGIPGASASYALGGFSVEGIFVPFAFTDRLALRSTNPWSIVPRAEGAHFEPGDQELDLRDWEFGLRASLSHRDLDLSVMTSRTRDRAPSALRITPDARGLAFTPEHLRSWMVAASLVYSLDRYLLKTDVAYVDYAKEYDGIVEDGVRLVSGVETRGQVAENGNFTLLLQYALDTTTPGKVKSADGRSSSPYHWFRHALVGSARASFTPRIEAELTALLDLIGASLVASATLTYRPTDEVSLYCEGSFLSGPNHTWIGRIDFADRLLVGVAFQH